MFLSKNTAGRRFGSLAALFLLLALPAFGLAQTASTTTTPAPLTAETKTKILDGVKNILQTRAFVPHIDFTKWDEMISASQEKLDQASSENDFVREVNAVLRNFGISHVGLRTPRSAAARTATTTTGLGLTAKGTANGLEILAVAPESPAAKAGILQGDFIIKINGTATTEQTALPQSSEEILMTVKRKDGTEAEVKVKSTEFRIASRDLLTWVDEETAVIRVNSFSRGYERDKLEALIEEARKAKLIIVDLRNNGGGAVNNLAHLLGLFIPETEAVGSFVNRQVVKGFQDTTGKEDWTVKEVADWTDRKFRPTKPKVARFEGKVAVLINRGSASASEIFAGAIKEVGGGKIIGANTRGAVLASTYGRLEAGFELQYPVSDYVTVKGQRLEGDPVTPHVEVKEQRTVDGKDAYIQAAIDAWKTN